MEESKENSIKNDEFGVNDIPQTDETKQDISKRINIPSLKQLLTVKPNVNREKYLTWFALFLFVALIMVCLAALNLQNSYNELVNQCNNKIAECLLWK